MSITEPWIAPALFFAAGAALAVYLRAWFNTTERQRKAMRRLPVAKLNEAELGTTVVIRGRIQARSALLQSPLERRQCCAYRLKVWDASGDARQLVLDESNACELDLEADGVAASIRSPSITLEGRGEPHYSGKGDRPTGAQAVIIERCRLDPTFLIYVEYVLCPRDEVTVIAKVSSVDDGSLDDERFRYLGSGGYRSRPQRRVLVAQNFPLTIVAPGGEL